MKLFPALPADLAGATDEELAALQASHVEAMSKIKGNDAEFLGELSAADILAQFKAGREQYDAIKAEQDARVEAQQNFSAELEKLAADVPELSAEADTDDDEADSDSEADGEATAEAEEITAEAAEEAPVEAEAEVVAEAELVAAAPRFTRPPAVAKQHKPQPATPAGAALVASSGLESVQPGQALTMESLERAFIEATRRNSVRPGAADVVVASAHYDFPSDRKLDQSDLNENGVISFETGKVQAVVGEEALVASGGICAPVTPYYELQNIAVTDRPVRDALAAFQAVRGGLRFAAPPTIGDITNGVGRITAAQDAAGGSSGTKTCQTIICPQFSEVDVAAIYHCLSAGNLGQRAYPEQLAQFIQLIFAAHARAAETALLDGISAGSTQVTAAQIGGATSSLFPAMLSAAAQIRSHYRMAANATLRVLMPAWAKDFLKADIVRQPFDKFQISDAELATIFASFNLNVSFFLDGETGGNQVLAVQNTGPINGWPTAVKWFIFPEGTWLYLDGGTLELGIVRDSSLNATNTFQEFGETWENVAKVGAVSYEVTSTVEDTGALSAPITINAPAY